MEIIEQIKEEAQKNPQKIVLVESEDQRILEAAEISQKEGLAHIILVGDETEISKKRQEYHLSQNIGEIINPKTYVNTQKMIDKLYELRKEKGLTKEMAENLINENSLYFGCMLVKMGIADGMVAGATHTSSSLLRAALQVIKTSPDAKIASSFTLLSLKDCPYGEQGIFLYADTGLNQNPTSEELSEIAISSAKSFEQLVKKKAYVAMLSHSTLGSAPNHPDILKVQNATKIAKEKDPSLALEGELQLDAAIVEEVAKIKTSNNPVAGRANVLIFPDLDAGNIAYKLTERLGKANAYGPITQGLAKPINDLSRGCKTLDIVGVIAITSLQAQKQ